MIKCYALDALGYIGATYDEEFAPSGSPSFNFPEDFDFSRQRFFKIDGGSLVEDTEKEAGEEKEKSNTALTVQLRATDSYITDAFESLLGVLRESTALTLVANILKWSVTELTGLKEVLEQREALRRELEE